MEAQTITGWLAIPTIESGILPWKIRKFFNIKSFDCMFNVYSDFGNA